MRKWLIFILFIKIIDATPTPIVLWHGMGDTCCLSLSLGSFMNFLKDQIPEVYIHSLRMGNSTIEDFESGYVMNPNHQVAKACEAISDDPELKDGFNAIGFSQGSQFLRAVVQRCGHELPPIKNLISLGGQHQGVYGVPNCAALSHSACNYIRKLLNYAAYAGWAQNSIVQATYWHDPLDEKQYKQKSIFLSDINNEQRVNKTYNTNLNNLQHFVMVMFGNDTIVQPKETEWFGFYRPGQAKELQTLQESDLYKQDRLGLKAMDEAGKLVFLSTPGNHIQLPEKWFINNILIPYLK